MRPCRRAMTDYKEKMEEMTIMIDCSKAALLTLNALSVLEPLKGKDKDVTAFIEGFEEILKGINRVIDDMLGYVRE